jgi:UMF1 family MFS transporter
MAIAKYLPRYGWYLYDFGRTILITNGGLYFPQWLVNLNGVSDLTYNLTFILSSALLIVSAPLLGLSADYRNSTLKYLVGSSIILTIAGIGVGIAPLIEDRTARVVLAVLSFFVVLVSYQLSLVFYNTLLGQVSAADEYERVSGQGLAWGWFGGITAIFFGLMFSGTAGANDGIRSILPSALITGALMSIGLYLISRAPPDPRAPPAIKKGLWAELAVLRSNHMVWAFLISYFLFSDAILTLHNNSTIYMQAVLGLADSQKALQFLLILITSAVGSLASVPFVRQLGLKKGLAWIIAACSIVVLITPAFTTPIAFSIIFGLLGLLNGGVWNVSRVLFFRLIPVERRNTYFGLYSTFERFSSIIGPIAWTIPVTLIGADVLRYQVAWMGMSIFLLVSLALLVRVKIPH